MQTLLKGISDYAATLSRTKVLGNSNQAVYLAQQQCLARTKRLNYTKLKVILDRPRQKNLDILGISLISLKKKSQTILFLLFLLAACLALLWVLDLPQKIFFKTDYLCVTRGYSYRYQDGKRIDKAIPDPLRFELKTFKYSKHYEIEKKSIFLEHQNQNIVRNTQGSTNVEDLYLYDVINPTTHERTQTSLVINNLSGDMRLMHHRWMPPKGWENSDLYYFSGYCLSKEKIITPKQKETFGLSDQH